MYNIQDYLGAVRSGHLDPSPSRDPEGAYLCIPTNWGWIQHQSNREKRLESPGQFIPLALLNNSAAGPDRHGAGVCCLRSDFLVADDSGPDLWVKAQISGGLFAQGQATRSSILSMGLNPHHHMWRTATPRRPGSRPPPHPAQEQPRPGFPGPDFIAWWS